VCYKTALYLAPREFRWIYYLAKLEKSAFNYEASEALFLLTAQMKPKDAELWAELADLYLMGARKEEAARSSGKALELDPMQPTAILAQARLLSLEGKWNEVIPLLEPLLERYPRLSAAHRYLAGAYGALGDEDKRAFHQVLGEHGTSIESERMRELEELAIPAILEGAPARGAELVESKCTRCHDTRRIQEFDEDRRWWARTIRRMQRQAGWDWLTDDEAAALVAHLARRRS
jgi:tetratricopeptide (TPR) repeat protein